MTIHRFRVRLSTGAWRTIWLVELPLDCGCDGTLQGWLQEKVGEPIEEYRYQPPKAHVSTVTLILGETERRYGGPEEGGWWQTVFYPRRTFTVRAAYANRARHWLSKLGVVQTERRYPPLTPSTHYC